MVNALDPQNMNRFSEASVSVEIETEDMTLNIGPQHPSTHGVLRLVAKVDGEKVHDVKPVLGYMHRGYEKLAEVRSYPQITTLVNRIDWDNEVSVGEAPKESVSPSFEIITCLSDLDNTNLVTVSTSISKSEPNINSLIDVYAGANWHEREAYEMFGINFENHPNLEKLYLPDGYEGNPMLKSFELISREVKPWPGDVDVEGMPEESESEGSVDG